ncbi:unnamed protein product [Lymnaea stagnalis]|uniref:BTB domain-containing protein n=1 Tax=Lymnaea stagnalis TaxID=6523 RepID=A0AAV2INA7_LYMST
MEIDIDIAHGVMNSLNKLYVNKELEDFVVDIDGTEFKCHRVILGSCSEFFGGLFRSGMKEVDEGRASVQGISVEAFQLILKALYTGINVLTKDNVIDIWHASNQLQIQFLIKLCEKSVVSWLTLENFEEVFFHAKLIQSETVLEGARKFMLENFENVRKTKTFLNLSFIDLLRVVEDRDLVVKSEDLVLESLMEWVGQPKIEKSELDASTKANIRITSDKYAAQINAVTQISTKESRSVSGSNGCGNNHNDGIKDDQQVGDLEKEQSRSHEDTSLNASTAVRPVEIAKESAFEALEGELVSQGQTDTKQNSSTFQDGSGTDPKNPDWSNDSGGNLLRERLEKLPKLLAVTRTCLASVSLLHSLYKHPFIQSNNCAKDILFNAILYHTRYMHGQWPTAALHRKCSDFDHYGVQMNTDRTCKALSIFEERLFNLTAPCDSDTQILHLVVFDNDLYCCSFDRYEETSKLLLFRDKSWTFITELPGRKSFLLVHEDVIYAINSEQGHISMINPRDSLSNRNNVSSVPETGTFEYAIIVDRNMLVFSTETKDGVEETAVQCWDLVYNTWMRLDSLEGPAKH